MRKTTTIVGVLTAALLFLSYFVWRKYSVLPQDALLKLTLDDKVESLDPAKAFSDDSLLISAQVLEPLYQYHYLKRPYEVEPLLAEAMPTFSEKGTVVTIKIKKNIFFHPHAAFQRKKRELTAEDFVTAFKRLALDSLKSPGRSLFQNLVEGFDSYSASVGDSWEKISETPLDGVKAIDRYTLQLRLLKSEPNIIYYLALNFVAPVPWEVVQFEKNILDKILVGTGPYLLKAHDEVIIDMEKNPAYRQDFYPTSGDRYANMQKLLDSRKQRIPFISKVRFYVTGDEELRWQMFIKREIDLLTVPKTLLPRLYDSSGSLNPELKKKNVEVMHFPTLANRWLAFNMRHPLVGKNLNLRKAVSYAIDYSQYIQVLSQNTNLRANSILVPGISGYLPAKDFRFNYDLEKAKEHLKLAGFSETKKPEIIYSTRGNQGVNLMEADFIKKQLERAGFKVNIQVLTFQEFLKKGRAGELMFFTDNWLFDYPDGENILQLLVSTNFPGINKSAYSNPKVDEMYRKLKETANQEQRDKIIQDTEEIIFQDLPWIPMMYESSFVIQYPEIKNFRKSSIIRNYVKYLKIEK